MPPRPARRVTTGRRGRPPKPPEDGPPPPPRQSNLTAPDSALMRRSDAHEYRQACVAPTARGADAQAVVCAEGSQPILATNLTACPSVSPSFARTILGMQRGIGKVAAEWSLIALACNFRRLHRLRQT